MLYFGNERRHGIGNLKKDLLLGHLQAPLDKNSEDLAILILEFDDVTVKTILFFSFFSRRVHLGVQFGVHVFYGPCSRPIKISIQ